MVLGRLHLAVEHSVNVDMLRRFDVDVDVMGRFVGLIFAEFRADSGLAVIIKLGCVGCSRTMKILCLCDRLGLDLTVVNEIAIQSGDLIGVEVPILIVGRLAVHVQFCNNGVALLLPVGVKVRPAVHGLAGHVAALAFTAPGLEGIAGALRGGRVHSGQSRALACGGAGQRRYGIIVVLIGFQVFLSVEVDDLLIVVDHALEVRPAVDGDLFQTGRGIGRIPLVIIPPAVVVPAVEVIFSGIVRGVVVANVDRGQVNDRALRLTSEINSPVRIRRVAVAVDHKLDGAQILRFLNILRIAAVVAGARTRAVKLAVLSGSPIVPFHGKLTIFVTFCVQDAIFFGNAVIIANAAYRDALVMVCLGIDHFAVLPDGGVAKVDKQSAGVISRLATKAKQSRAGNFIRGHAGDRIVSGNIDNILIAAHIAVVDVQHRLQAETVIHNRAAHEIDNDIILTRTIIGIDIDDLTGRVKGAVVKGHYGRTVRPDGIISARTVERGIRKLCGLIAPVEGLAVDYAIINNGVIRTNKAQIICTSGLERHVLERDRSRAVEAVIAVVLCAEVSRIRNCSADAPLGLTSSLTHKGQVFVLCHSTLLMQRILTLAQLDGIAALSGGNRFFQGLIRLICCRTDAFLRVIAGCCINIDRPAST